MKPKRDWMIVAPYDVTEQRSSLVIPDVAQDAMAIDTSAWVVKDVGPECTHYGVDVGDIVIMEGRMSVPSFTFDGKKYYGGQAKYVAFVMSGGG